MIAMRLLVVIGILVVRMVFAIMLYRCQQCVQDCLLREGRPGHHCRRELSLTDDAGRGPACLRAEFNLQNGSMSTREAELAENSKPESPEPNLKAISPKLHNPKPRTP